MRPTAYEFPSKLESRAHQTSQVARLLLSGVTCGKLRRSMMVVWLPAALGDPQLSQLRRQYGRQGRRVWQQGGQCHLIPARAAYQAILACFQSEASFRRTWDKEEFAQKAREKDREEKERMQENEELMRKGLCSTCPFASVSPVEHVI
jgi:hypothetical protein